MVLTVRKQCKSVVCSKEIQEDTITLIADIELSIQLSVEYKQEIKLRVYEECNQINGPIMQ